MKPGTAAACLPRAGCIARLRMLLNVDGQAGNQIVSEYAQAGQRKSDSVATCSQFCRHLRPIARHCLTHSAEGRHTGNEQAHGYRDRVEGLPRSILPRFNCRIEDDRLAITSQRTQPPTNPLIPPRNCTFPKDCERESPWAEIYISPEFKHFQKFAARSPFPHPVN